MEKNRRAFEDAEQLKQAIKFSFKRVFWDWIGVYISDTSMSMIRFVDWLNSTVNFC